MKRLVLLMCLVTFHDKGEPVHYNLDNLVTVKDVTESWGNGSYQSLLLFVDHNKIFWVDESIDQVLEAARRCQ